MNHNMIHTEHFPPTVIRTWIFLATSQCLKIHFRIALTICTNQFHLPKTERPRNHETGIKDRFWTRISVWNIPSGKKKKQNCLFRCSVAPGNFPLETRVPFASRLELTECIGNWRAPTLTLTGYSTLRLTYEVLLPTCFVVHLFIYIFDFFPSFQKIQKVLVIQQALRTLTPQSCQSVPDS